MLSLGGQIQPPGHRLPTSVIVNGLFGKENDEAAEYISYVTPIKQKHIAFKQRLL